MTRDEEIRAVLKEEIDRATQMSTTYGQLVIRNGILLNAGALLAIPAFLEASIMNAGGLSVWIIGSFVFGLIAAVTAASLAHLQAFSISVKLQKQQLNTLGIGAAAEQFGFWQKVLFLAVYVASIGSHIGFAIGAVKLVLLVSQGGQ